MSTRSQLRPDGAFCSSFNASLCGSRTASASKAPGDALVAVVVDDRGGVADVEIFSLTGISL